jgi:hypothetical protein
VCIYLKVFCESSDLFYNPIESNFDEGDTDGWIVSDKSQNLNTSKSLKIQNNKLEFNQYDDEYKNQELYFIAPNKFKGNKLTSYGGNLTFKIHFEGSSQINERTKKLSVRLIGVGTDFIYHSYSNFGPYKESKIVILLREESFRRFDDDTPIERYEFLMALSNIEHIMIRASFVSRQYSVSLDDVSMSYGENFANSKNDGSINHKALSVEVCQCPIGYAGTSCEVILYLFFVTFKFNYLKKKVLCSWLQKSKI